MMTYILERSGWNQWLDDGGVWQKNRDAARGFDSETEATEKAAQLNEEFAAHAGDEPRSDVIVVKS